MTKILRFSRGLHCSQSRLARYGSSYTSESSTVDTGDIASENNPWSPTLYTDRVYIKSGLRNKALPPNFRLSYEPLYEAPSTRYVSLLKKMTLGFAFAGAYGSKLLFDLVQFEDVYAAGLLVGTLTPALVVNYKLKDYVTRIFRLYDKDKPQDLETLTSNEQLVVEKLNASGGKTYNTLLNILNNPTLKLSPENHTLLKPYSSWTDEFEGVKQSFYITDNIGGMKMDRLWGIVENNSGVTNGRYMEDSEE